MKKLHYIGKDDWSRPVYVCDGTLFVDDTPMKNKEPHLYTLSGNLFDGEPNVSIRDIEEYKDEEIHFIPKRITWNYGN